MNEAKQLSLSLCTVIAEELKQETPAAPNKSGPPEQCILQCTGDLSAQVALLQSPILPAAKISYSINQNLRGLPVDKPHTRPLAVYLSLLTFCVSSSVSICEGMSFVSGASWKTQVAAVAERTETVTLRTCWYMRISRWAYGTCSWMDFGVTLRIRE